MFLYGSKYYKTKHQDKLKMLKIYQPNYAYDRNWPIFSIQFCKITGYQHTKYTIRIKKTGHFEK